MRALEEWSEYDSISIVGHSMGAFLGSSFALAYPNLVTNLVLASPVGVPKAPANKLGRMAGGWRRKLVFKLVFMLWEKGWTPQFVMRWGGARFGKAFAEKVITGRFQMKTQEAREALVEYFYRISAATASGEYSLCTVLESGAYARRPLIDRLHQLTIPVALLYGDRDWMSADAGIQATKRLNVKSWVKVIENAGHHLYFDNPNRFNDLVIKACTEMSG